MQSSPVFAGVFFVARKFYLLFQQHAAEDNFRELNRVRSTTRCTARARQQGKCVRDCVGPCVPLARQPGASCSGACAGVLACCTRPCWAAWSDVLPCTGSDLTPSLILSSLLPQGWGLTGLSYTAMLGNTTAVVALDTRGERSKEQVVRPASWAAFQDQVRGSV